MGGTDPAYSTLSQLHYVLRGMCCLHPTCARQRRLPITIGILRLLFSRWSSPVTYEGIMLWAACTLAFFGFLRSGEFIPTHTYDITLALLQLMISKWTASPIQHCWQSPYAIVKQTPLGQVLPSTWEDHMMIFVWLSQS